MKVQQPTHRKEGPTIDMLKARPMTRVCVFAPIDDQKNRAACCVIELHLVVAAGPTLHLYTPIHRDYTGSERIFWFQIAKIFLVEDRRGGKLIDAEWVITSHQRRLDWSERKRERERIIYVLVTSMSPPSCWLGSRVKPENGKTRTHRPIGGLRENGHACRPVHMANSLLADLRSYPQTAAAAAAATANGLLDECLCCYWLVLVAVCGRSVFTCNPSSIAWAITLSLSTSTTLFFLSFPLQLNRFGGLSMNDETIVFIPTHRRPLFQTFLEQKTTENITIFRPSTRKRGKKKQSSKWLFLFPVIITRRTYLSWFEAILWRCQIVRLSNRPITFCDRTIAFSFPPLTWSRFPSPKWPSVS